MVREGRQISFDVIANVRKLVDPDDPKRYFSQRMRGVYQFCFSQKGCSKVPN